MRDLITLLEEKSRPDDIEIVNLSYGLGALSPVLSTTNLRYHYGKLAHAYAEKFNKREGDPNFNYSGAWLHNLLFTQYRAPRTNNKPNGPVGNLIKTKFKDWDNFKEKFAEAALKIQGSGWAYLARDGQIKTIPNHQIRTDILVLIDMWEHSYSTDYGADKKRYLENIWRIIDWNVINTRWAVPYRGK
jgi:Fe-Mn family superoxide dismutase